MTSAAMETGPDSLSRYGGRFAIYLLALIYMFNMLDRQIIMILVEPMKRDLGLSDTQIGAVSGLAFALLYSTAGLPLARLGDRVNRATMITASLAIWSGFTVLCGSARNFSEMLLARAGVGIGEAGCTPAAHSLIVDYFPREKRASALAIYQLGVPLGTLAGLAIGGFLLSSLGWRMVFVLAGIPGIILAIALPFLLRDPHRARRASAPQPPLPIRTVLKELGQKRAFRNIALGTALAAFSYYGITAFLGSFYMRTHDEALTTIAEDMGLAPAAFLGIALGVMAGAFACIGTIAGGWLADRCARQNVRGYTHVSCFALLAEVPLIAMAVLTDNITLSFVLLGAGFFVHSLTYGSTFASVQSLASPSMRATASAIHLFITTAIGLGLGPLCVGLVSDSLVGSMGSSMGLQMAMALATVPTVLAALLFWRGGRTIVDEEVR